MAYVRTWWGWAAAKPLTVKGVCITHIVCVHIQGGPWHAFAARCHQLLAVALHVCKTLALIKNPACLCVGLQVRNQLAVVRSSEYTLIKSRFDELLARQQKVGAGGQVVWGKEGRETVVIVC